MTPFLQPQSQEALDMADINQVITLGLGTPSGIKEFLTFGLQIGAGIPNPWTKQADTTTTWSSKADSTTIWTEQTDSSTTWTVQ